MGDMAKVQLQGVRKVYDNGQVAVQGATFEVADGELMVLVWPAAVMPAAACLARLWVRECES